MDWLTDPWQFEFMQRALLAGVLVSLAAAAVGAYVVLKGLAFLGDAVAHTQLAGAAVALVLGGGAIAITLGAAVAAVATALGIAFLTIRARIREDTAIGIVFAGLFAVGVLLISSQRTFTINLRALLVGNILGAPLSDIFLMAALAAVVLVAAVWFFPELRFVSYDPEMAAVAGVPVTAFRIGMLVLVALAAVVAFRLVGVVLSVAMLVAPAAAAALVVRQLHWIMILSGAIGIVSTVIGLYLAFHADLAAGPAIVLAAVAAVAVCFMLSPRGLARNLRRSSETPPAAPR